MSTYISPTFDGVDAGATMPDDIVGDPAAAAAVASDTAEAKSVVMFISFGLRGLVA
ncbi:MAG TPA: hypothetical protein VIQ23_18875 [Hanamia sp.]